MALQNGRVQAPPKGSRGAYEATYTTCRSSLLLVATITLLNVVLTLMGSYTHFLFSASVPYYVSAFVRLFYNAYGFFSAVIIGGVIAVVLAGLYFVFWLVTKRHRKWMIGAAVYFALDCVGLIQITMSFGVDFSDILDYLFHAYTMYFLVTGFIAAIKLAKMPPEEPIVASADVVEAVEDAPAEAAPAEETAVEETLAEEVAEQAPVGEVSQEFNETAADEAEEISVGEGLKDYRGQTIAANYYRGLEAVGGKLAFDDLGMTFRSHALNIQTGETRIEYKDIECAQIRGMLTEISVFTKDGQDHRFVVYHRKDVIAFLESVKG